MSEFDGLVALVTGGASGIGAATARLLRSRGARVAVLDLSPDGALRRRQPLGRLVTAEEVAYAIASLASPLAGSTTGTILRVDGGMTNLRL